MGTEGPQVAETNFDMAGRIREAGRPVDHQGRPLRAGKRLAPTRPPPRRAERLLRGVRRRRSALHPLDKVARRGPRVRADPGLPQPEPPRRPARRALRACPPPPTRRTPGPPPPACSLFTKRVAGGVARTLGPLVPTLPGLHGPPRPLGAAIEALSRRPERPAHAPAESHAQEQDAVETLIPETRLLQHLSGAGRGMAQPRRLHSEAVRFSHGPSCHFRVYFRSRRMGELAARAARAAGQPGEPPPVWLVQRRLRPREYTLLEYTDGGPVEQHRRAPVLPLPVRRSSAGLRDLENPVHARARHAECSDIRGALYPLSVRSAEHRPLFCPARDALHAP